MLFCVGFVAGVKAAEMCGMSNSGFRYRAKLFETSKQN